VRLAISLHGASDEVREKIMPVNRKYPLNELFDALREWHAKRKQHLTFEYILIEGVNDDLEQAHLLAKRAKPLHAKVNLIPYNTGGRADWTRPSEKQQDAFQAVLLNAGVTATLRREKGHRRCGGVRATPPEAERMRASSIRSFPEAHHDRCGSLIRVGRSRLSVPQTR